MRLTLLLLISLLQPLIVEAQRPDTVPRPPYRLPPTVVRATSPAVERDARWPLSARNAVRDSLSAGHSRWNARRPLRYQLSAYKWCGFCPSRAWNPQGTHPVYTIERDSVVEVAAVANRDSTQIGDWLIMPVDALFLELETAVDDPSRQIIGLSLDPYYGYPVRWQVDDSRNGYGPTSITDQGYWARVLSFAADSAHHECDRLRRLLRRCG